MRQRKEKLVGMRIAAPAHDFLEQLANECDRPISGMARVLLYDRLGQIAAERGQPAPTAETPAGVGVNAAGAAAA